MSCHIFYVVKDGDSKALLSSNPTQGTVYSLEIDQIFTFQGIVSLNDGIEPKDGISCIEKFSELSNRNHDNSLASFLKETEEQSQAGQKKKSETSHTLVLFRKYPHDKARQAQGLANVEESEAAAAVKFQNKPCQSLLPPSGDASLYRRPTLLEKELQRGVGQPASNTNSPKGQLTIFYCGAIYVYDNVPADKAQAIILCAGECCLLDPVSPSTPTPADSPKCTSFPVAKMQAVSC